MPAIEVGSVAVSVVPDVKNFAKDTRAKLGPQADNLGVEIGKRIGAGIAKGIGDPLSKPLGELPKHRPQTGKDGESLGGAFADGFKRRVEAAFKSFPEPRIGADATEAEAKISDLRRELQTLSGKTVGLDIDAAAATAELDRIKAELDTLAAKSPNVQVRVDAASALAELAAFDAEVQRLDGRNVNVRATADTSSAIGALQALAIEMAVVGSIPVAASVGAGIAGLVGPLGAAAAGFGGLAAVAVPGVSRISKALQAQNTAQNQVASSGGRAAGAIRSVAVEQDQARIRALQMAAAQDQVAQAVRQAAQAHADALARVQDAERSLAQAQVQARQAQVNLNQARQQAKLDAQDLANSVIDAGLAVRSGQLSVEQAQAGLVTQTQATAQAAQAVADARTRLAQAQAAAAKVNGDAGSTDAQRKTAAQAVNDAKKQLTAAQQAQKQQQLAQREAQLAYDQAVQSLKEERLQLKRLQAQKAASDKAGINGDRNVIAARQQLASANAQVADAERAVARARQNVARVDAQSSATVASARRALLQQQLSAKLASDQEAAAARNAAGAAGGASAASLKYAAALAALTPAERDLMNHFLRLKDAYTQWAHALEPDVLPVLSRGLDLIKQQLPALTPLVRGSAAAFLDLENRAGAALKGPFWTQFFAVISREAPVAITRLGVAAGNTVTGIAGVVQAFLPYGNQLLLWIDQGTAKFSRWGQQLNSSTGFANFMAYVRDSGPAVIAAISGLWQGVQQLVIALAPAGPPLLEIVGGFGHLVGYLAQVDPSLVQLIALMYGLNKAVKVLQLASLVTNFSRAGAAAGAFGLAIRGAVAAENGKKLTTLVTGLKGISSASKDASTGLAGLGASARSLSVAGTVTALANLHGSAADADETVGYLGKTLLTVAKTGKVSSETLAYGTTQLDNALASLIKSGHPAEAQRAFNVLAQAQVKQSKAAGGSITSVNQLKAQYPQYSKAVQAATTKTQSFTTALTSLYNRSKGDLLSANLQVAQSIKAVGDAFAANGAKIRGNSLAALENKSAVSQAAQSISAYVTGVYSSTKAQKGETAARQASLEALKSRRKALINEMVQAGLTRTAATKLANQYLKTPKAVATRFTTPGAATARKQVQSLGTAIAHIHGKRVVVNANTKGARTQIGAFYRWFNKLDFQRTATIGFKQLGPGRQGVPLGAKADGGIMRFANGTEKHVAQVAKPGEIRMFGEKETGGEAYIPLSPSKRPRSLAILRQVAKEFGFALAPLAAAGSIAAFAAGGITKPVAVTKAAAKVVPVTTAGGNSPAAQMAGLANAATAANVATEDLSTTALPGFTAAARTTVPASNLAAGRLAVLAARTKTQSDRTAVATTRLRSMGTQSAGASSTAASTLTRRVNTLTSSVSRNSATSVTNTARLRTATTATNTQARATGTSTLRVNANTGALRTQDGVLATNAARLRKVATDAGTARVAVNKFVDAYRRKPYSITRHITVDAKGKFTMTGLSKGWATGGPVHGPGTATSDSIPARLSDGEHVWTAREVRAAGGHGNVAALRQAAVQGRAPGFAKGGPVTKTRTIGTESVPKFTPDYERMMNLIVSATVKTTASESAKIIKSMLGGTGQAADVIRIANSYIGTREHPMGSNRQIFGARFGMNGVPWCAIFVDEVFKQAGAKNAVPWTAAVAGFNGSHLKRRHGQPHPGDLFTYGDDHINIYTGPGRRTVGGNQSNAVTADTSHYGRRSATLIPNYAKGVPGGGIGLGGKNGYYAYAKDFMRQMGMSVAYNWPSLYHLWMGESHWNPHAVNRSSGAGGIPQALPPSKMGAGWYNNPGQQIGWGLRYIRDRYHNPVNAYRAWQARSPHWYDNGGVLPPGPSLVYNGTGRPEPVLTDQQWRTLEASTVGGDGGGTVEYHAHFDGASRAELRHLTQSEFYRQSVRQNQATRPNRRR